MKIEKRDDYILLPKGEMKDCFGCGMKNDIGLHMDFYTTEKRESVVSWLCVPDHLCGWSNIVHGGIISTMLDEAMGWAGLIVLNKLVVSKSITVDFIKPVLIGKQIMVEGNVGKVNGDREVVLEGCIYNDKNEICARSSSLASLFTFETMRKIGFTDEEMLGDMEQLQKKLTCEE